MILISSMGGCGSTNMLNWFSARLPCNCPYNSEGLTSCGPGSNHKGLKHRIRPPVASDPYLLSENSYNRTDLNYGPIEKALFLYDNPLNVIPSLFNRRIAGGHAVALTGKRPPHGNVMESFVNENVDSFQFYDQFRNWTNFNDTRPYKRMLVNFSYLWEYIDVVLDFLGIGSEVGAFLPKRERGSSFDKLTNEQQICLANIYNKLADDMNKFPRVVVM